MKEYLESLDLAASLLSKLMAIEKDKNAICVLSEQFEKINDLKMEFVVKYVNHKITNG